MKGEKIEFYIYANNEIEAEEAQKAIFTFIEANRQMGVVVTAEKLTSAIEQWKHNSFVQTMVSNYFRK